ncbi:LysE family transporter [Micromonospora sp. S-DT3-3-22]|uniref:LysE family transporter n=1 Tax=Micromonospora sp. S-DT3-3-22 TaxID=2755359 RepID=UPI00188F2C2B|nr:LysE family transporter [Micromonospora sp. S-DT3-3-22]
MIASWGDAPRYLSGLVIVGLGCHQLVTLRRAPAHPGGTGAGAERDGTGGERPARSAAGPVFVRFVLLTAVNPLTLVYFFALGGTVNAVPGSWTGPGVFVVAAGLASLLWQAGLATIGAALGATVPVRVADLLGVVASLIVVALGATVVVVTAVT